MGDLTQDRPKPLIEVAGRPLLDHALDLVAAAGPLRTVVNTHYKAEMIARHLEGRGAMISHEAPDILETGGGLRQALPLLGADPVFTLNPDAVWSGPNPLEMLRDAWQPDAMDALLLCIPPGRALGHAGNGDFTLDSRGRLSRGPGVIFGGAQIVSTHRLSEIPERAFSLNRLWDLMQAGGRLHGLIYPGSWCDVGTPAGIALAEGMLKDG